MAEDENTPDSNELDDALIEIRWSDERSQALLSNQVVVQITPLQEVIITFGQLTPPLIVGNSEDSIERQRKALTENGVEVQIAAKILMSIPCAKSLQAFLKTELGE